MPLVRATARVLPRSVFIRSGFIRSGFIRSGFTRSGFTRSVLALAMLSLAVLAAGCHVPGTSSASPAANQHLTVAVVPGIETAPLQLAVKDGLFAQHGVTVTIKDVASVKDAYTALSKGTVDVAAGDYTSFFYAIASPAINAKLKLIADGYDASAGTMQVLTLPSSGITSPTELKNKVVATPFAQVAPYTTSFPYNVETLAAQQVLSSEGLSTTDITWRQTSPDNMISALADHKVSAILVTDPQIIEAETQLGAVEVFDACSGVTANLPLSGYFSTDTFADQHAAALLDFRAALFQAQGDASVRSTVQSVLTGEHLSTEDAALVNIGSYPTFTNVGQVQRDANLMYDSGMILGPISVSSLLLK
jgi:NitT/TauT family transport system substrate-binding protein